MKSILAVDVGGTTMRAAVVDLEGDVDDRRTVPTPLADRCPAVLLALAGSVLADVDTAVIGVPGRIHFGAGRLEHSAG